MKKLLIVLLFLSLAVYPVAAKNNKNTADKQEKQQMPS